MLQGRFLPAFSVCKYYSWYPNQSPLSQKPVLSALHLAFYRFPVFFFSPNTSPLLLFLKSCRDPLPKAAYCSDRCIDSCPRKPHVSFLAIAPIKVAMRLCLSFIDFPLLPPPLPPSPPPLSLPFFFFFSEIAILIAV